MPPPENEKDIVLDVTDSQDLNVLLKQVGEAGIHKVISTVATRRSPRRPTAWSE